MRYLRGSGHKQSCARRRKSYYLPNSLKSMLSPLSSLRSGKEPSSESSARCCQCPGHSCSESQGDSSPSSCTAIVHMTRNWRWNPWDTGKTGVTLLGRVTAGGRKQVKAQGPLEGHQCRHLNSSQSMFHLGVIWRKFFIKDLMEVSLD